MLEEALVRSLGEAEAAPVRLLAAGSLLHGVNGAAGRRPDLVAQMPDDGLQVRRRGQGLGGWSVRHDTFAGLGEDAVRHGEAEVARYVGLGDAGMRSERGEGACGGARARAGGR